MKATRSATSDQASRTHPCRASSKSGSCKASVRVICVDDHALLVDGLRARFASDGRISVIRHIDTADELLCEVSRSKPDLVLLDIEMPGPDAFEIASRLHHEHPGIPFVFLSAHIRDGYLAAAFRCGASGYFAKGESVSDIIEGIVRIASSTSPNFVLTPKVKAHCMPVDDLRSIRAASSRSQAIEVPVSTPLESLTVREIEILRLIGKGLSRAEIAKEIARSPKTVDGHQERIMKKLAVESRTELLRLAIREGLAEA